MVAFPRELVAEPRRRRQNKPCDALQAEVATRAPAGDGDLGHAGRAESAGDALLVAPEWETQGLSSAEAEQRRQCGLANEMPVQTSRSYWQILRENIFTFINISLFVLGIALIVLGRGADALISVGLVAVNVTVSALQEVRAKRKLDRIALLTRPAATVVRDGREQDVDPSQVVMGDLLVLRPGDQAVVDGPIVGNSRVDMDESLLTGESEVVPKGFGDSVYSGSFCVAGSTRFRAERVGAQSMASQITATARAFRRVATPLQFYISLVVRVLLLAAVFIEMLLIGVTLIYNTPVLTSVRNSVVVIGLVPQGLFLSITVAYALGAVRIAGQTILVQQSNAIESLSNVDVLCLDKTGTLTANRIRLQTIHPLELPEGELRELLGDFAASVTTPNATFRALIDCCPGTPRSIAGEVPFVSERRWSGMTLVDGPLTGTFVLGAPETLRPYLAPPRRHDGVLSLPAWAQDAHGRYPESRGWQDATRASGLGHLEAETWEQLAEAWSERGLRVVLFAGILERDGSMGDPLHGTEGEPCLPSGLVPLGLLSFSDELRPDASQTLARFAAAGIAIKIISGDNPHTVAALARQAGLGPEIRTMTGQKLASLDASQLPDAVGSTTVFGRISPQQKATLVQVLKQRGHYVAMTGDGINDVMALKQAHLGIAMEAGSQATRAVADLVLLGNSFSALPAAFEEGQRIRNGMQDVLKLFLTRLLVVTVLVGAVGFVGGFAFTPRQVSLVGFMTVGLPTVVLAARAGTGMMDPRNRLLSIFHFVLPAGLSLAASALTTYLVVLYAHSRWLMAASPGLTHAEAMQGAVPAAQTGLAVMLVLCGLALVPFVVPPFARWQPGGAPHLRPMGALTNPGDQDVDARPTVVAMLLLVSFAVILATPTLRDLFEMVPLGKLEYALIAGQALLWVLLMRWAWRRQVLERFLYGEMPI